jgi:hypothetical protein
MCGENPTAGSGRQRGCRCGLDFVGLLVSVPEFETVLGRDITLGLMTPAQKVLSI